MGPVEVLRGEEEGEYLNTLLQKNINVISNQPHSHIPYLYHLHYQSHHPLRMKLDILSPIIILSDITDEPDLFEC